MTARGANIALDTDATLARSNSIDITNDVLTALNTQVPVGQRHAAAAAGTAGPAAPRAAKP